MRETSDPDGAPNFKGGLFGSLPSRWFGVRTPSACLPTITLAKRSVWKGGGTSRKRLRSTFNGRS